MKKKIMLIIVLLLIGIINVNAKKVEELTSDEYKAVSMYLNDDEIEFVSDKVVDTFINGDVLSSKGVVIATTYSRKLGQLPEITTTMLADSYSANMTLSDACEVLNSSFIDCTTEYKYYRLTVGSASGYTEFYLYNKWLKMPKYKSFDLLGVRWTGDFERQTQTGNQYTNGNSGNITYLSGNSNFKKTSSGVGLSQNLVDSATHIESELVVIGVCDTGGTVYASYQHARANITLATSQKYNFSASGMGGVFGFYDGVSSYYDNTPGIQLNYTCE